MASLGDYRRSVGAAEGELWRGEPFRERQARMRQAGQKAAGRVKFDDITLEKGALQDGADVAALDWIKELVDLSACGTHRQA